MRHLLDTHAFLWWITDDERLTVPARDAIADAGNEILFSVASGWEIVIKMGIDRIRFHEPPQSLILREVERNGFRLLPVHLRHALAITDLPDVHPDPFDRMLVVQAIVEGASLVSGDHSLSGYPVSVVW